MTRARTHIRSQDLQRASRAADALGDTDRVILTLDTPEGAIEPYDHDRWRVRLPMRGASGGQTIVSQPGLAALVERMPAPGTWTVCRTACDRLQVDDGAVTQSLPAGWTTYATDWPDVPPPQARWAAGVWRRVCDRLAGPLQDDTLATAGVHCVWQEAGSRIGYTDRRRYIDTQAPLVAPSEASATIVPKGIVWAARHVAGQVRLSVRHEMYPVLTGRALTIESRDPDVTASMMQMPEARGAQLDASRLADALSGLPAGAEVAVDWGKGSTTIEASGVEMELNDSQLQALRSFLCNPPDDHPMTQR